MLFQPSNDHHQSEVISPNHESKIVLSNTNDDFESFNWLYEIHNLSTGNKKTLAECSSGGLVPYKLLRWSDNQHFVVEAELEKPETPKQIIVSIRSPKIPCDFSRWDLLSPQDKAELANQYIIIPSKTLKQQN